MGFFDFLFGAMGTKPYRHLAAWLRKKRSDLFRDGMSASEVKSNLMAVSMQGNKGYQKAIQKYILEEKFDDLVKIQKQ